MGRWNSVKSGRTKTTDIQQHKRFIETARELGCDEDEAAFDEKLKRIVTAKPKPKPKPSEKGRSLRRARTAGNS
jgi:hypothetical protein